jgi:hypothetical protein
VRRPTALEKQSDAKYNSHTQSHLQTTLLKTTPKRPTLAAKQGFVGIYFTLFFAFFLLFGDLRVAIRCHLRTSVDQTPPKKIIPK